MQTLNFRNFKGMSQDETLWQEAYAKYVAGADVFGMEDISTIPSRPGVLQGVRRMAAAAEAAAADDVTDLIRHFARFSGGSASVWGFSGESSPRLYERASGIWTRRRSGADLTTAAGGGGLIEFAAKLLVFQNSRCSSWDGTTWVASEFAFTNTGSNPRPSKVYEGFTYIGNAQTLVRWDGTTKTDVFSLSSNFIIRSVEVYGNKLAFTSDNGQFSRLYFYLHGSDTYETTFDIPYEPTAPKLFVNNGLLWIFGTYAIYVFNGSGFDKIFTLPIGAGITGLSTGTAAAAEYRGNIVFGVNDPSSADFEDGVGGGWLIGRYRQGYPWGLILGYVTDGLAASTIGGIYASGADLIIASNTGSTYSVYEADASDQYNNAIWQSLPIDAGDPVEKKVWYGIELEAETLDTSRDIEVKYRLDRPSGVSPTFTSLKVITSAAQGKNIFIPIGRTSRSIEVRFELGAGTTGGADPTTRLFGYKLYYDICRT